MAGTASLDRSTTSASKGVPHGTQQTVAARRHRCGHRRRTHGLRHRHRHLRGKLRRRTRRGRDHPPHPDLRGCEGQEAPGGRHPRRVPEEVSGRQGERGLHHVRPAQREDHHRARGRPAARRADDGGRLDPTVRRQGSDRGTAGEAGRDPRLREAGAGAFAPRRQAVRPARRARHPHRGLPQGPLRRGRRSARHPPTGPNYVLSPSS